MKAADLRKSILQAAVQGKLVPQDKNDEPASELLKRVQAEKVALIKDGKLKKEKPLPPITEDEIPYDLPEGWVWCHFGEVSTIASNLVSPESYQDFLHLAPDNIVKGTGHLLKCRTVREDYVRSNNHRFRRGQIIYSKIRPALKKAVIAPFDGLCSADMYPLSVYICPDYFLFFLLSDFFTVQVIRNDTRVKMPKTNQDELIKVVVPVPPINEQQRIASKVKQLMTMCDELEAAEKELDTLEGHFFDYLPKSILQAAVQGKLVPQDKNDEPASELLKRIQAEKAVLIKEGKLKKEKPLPPITEDEIPYDLPEGWVWCRLGNIIFDNVGGGTPSKQHAEYWNGEIPWASVKDLNCDVLTQTQDHITQLGLENSTSNLIQPGAIIVCMRMGLGKIAVSKIAVAINQDLRALTLSKENVLPNYFIYWYKTLTIEGGGMTVKGITILELSRMLFPLPPLKEQQRIVAKVDELMALCDELKRVADQPINHDNVIQFPAVPKENNEPIAMAARGEVGSISDQAKQAIEDLFGEDE
ncbi:restriction endonuclease subunit S [Intestinimonas butyriciproducens]|uniref:restriction endonuclease subunit S n=1 Tax=Intestinimonas butyriciproducens TaxID=1297617 RepID=UPI001C127356|nr:restriction endonuclease subunit S [Intestinimonas butyriciproducens]MBU5230914.1 restriction endonuclease subunit S [Intestinimonas butyriciproducens]